MSFDEVRLLLRVGYGASGGPCFSTEVVTASSGCECRNQNWGQARRKFDARTGVRSAEDAAVLLAFFYARMGKARGFRLKDWNDFSSSADGFSAHKYDDQIIAVGDGDNAVFQIIKNYGSGNVIHKRVIRKPVVDSVMIGVDGIEINSGYSVDAVTGLVTFAVPPAEGKIITAGFVFDVPVRFDCDQLSLSVEDGGQSKAEIPLIEIRV